MKGLEEKGLDGLYEKQRERKKEIESVTDMSRNSSIDNFSLMHYYRSAALKKKKRLNKSYSLWFSHYFGVN